MSKVIQVEHTYISGKTTLLQYWEYNCAKCGTLNTKRVLKQHHGKSPKYCNMACVKDGNLRSVARSIEAYNLWNDGKGMTLAAIGQQFGGVTRERARQLVNKGREYLAGDKHE